MQVEYIIIQAGGKGTRLQHLTKNKPKALVPVENLPMIFHLFNKFPDKKFIVIADYHKQVLKEYLRAFAKVEYILVEAEGTGTCGGLQQALSFIPEGAPFMYVWSDLILSESFTLPTEEGSYIGISCDFPCRWSHVNGECVEESSYENGIAGLFVFDDKARLSDVPTSGEFVRYLQSQSASLKRLELHGTREFGLLSEYEKLATEKCRPFNSMKIEGEVLIKEGIDAQGKQLAVREVAWYKKAAELGYTRMPEIYDYTPLKMQRIHGQNIYEAKDLDDTAKALVLERLVRNLQELHALESVPADHFSIQEAYINKTFDRLASIRDMIPFADQRQIKINGRLCANPYFLRDELEREIMSYDYSSFKFIHGDCTFSNMMLDENQEPVLIDPRGYFGHTKLYGDEDYDWAKLYYSLRGNYDQFNLKRFRLEVNESDITLDIESNGFEKVADQIFALLPQLNERKIKLLHAIIWLSLTTYAWQDYDSICGAFYNGCYYLQEVLDD